MEEESGDVSNHLVTGRPGGHHLPQNHLNLCPFTEQPLHITVLWIRYLGGFGVFLLQHSDTKIYYPVPMK